LIKFVFISFSAAFLAVGAGKAADLSSGDEQSAHKLYVVKCAKCHELYDPNKYTDPEWSAWMLKMKKKSKLKQEQFELLDRYMKMIRSERKTSVELPKP
jgi:hypothetical protein